MEVDEGCRTPTRIEYQIPAALVCPPPPKKKPSYVKQRRSPPKEGYFHPPDLEAILMNIAPRREACAWPASELLATTVNTISQVSCFHLSTGIWDVIRNYCSVKDQQKDI
ncbi:hypothetical protein SADUNF_Sadunf10G0156000 [Salix dunnii]|uniref:Uncharacterized protein n=1 Tax=Salix dunnii TaxID=1413687 RepID=A0A835JUE6_9ROSI|nr:hypothetical protein SADUNF_Sadunf10G0156000 [Salix dunnii]